MENTPIAASQTNSGLKNFIIGKVWTASKDGTRAGAIRISRDLPRDIVIKAGTTLYLNANDKREGKQDADFSVSVLLPTDVADQMIAAERVNASQRLSAQPLLA